MANASKAKGTRAETKVARYLTEHGFPTTRKALAGHDDEGDLRMLLPDGTEVTVEVKAGKQTTNYSRRDIQRWWFETREEGRNSKHLPILVIVRYQRKFDNAEVWIPNPVWFDECGWTMMYIDNFTDWIKYKYGRGR